MNIFLLLKIKKLSSVIILIFSDWDKFLAKFLNLDKNIILLLLLSSLINLLFISLIILSDWYLNKDNKIFEIEISSTVILINSWIQYW